MKKIGTLKGIPVVEGNENEVTKNQIHYKENGGGGFNSLKEIMIIN